MTAISIDPLQFWGKVTAKRRCARSRAVSSARISCADVAAVFEALTEADAELLGILASSFAASGERIVALLTVLVALHDIGKVSKKFQAKSEDAWPTMLGPPLSVRTSGTLRSCSGRL